MSKRQSEYLSSLLSDPAPAPAASGEASPPLPVPETSARPVRSTTLLERESALARIASGEVKQVTQLLMDPARVRIWPGNARHQASLTEESCRDLIDSILAEGGQKVPVVVRRVTDDETCDYELIAGTRPPLEHQLAAGQQLPRYPAPGPGSKPGRRKRIPARRSGEPRPARRLRFRARAELSRGVEELLRRASGSHGRAAEPVKGLDV